MARKRNTPEQIINKLRQAEPEIANGATVPELADALDAAPGDVERALRV